MRPPPAPRLARSALLATALIVPFIGFTPGAAARARARPGAQDPAMLHLTRETRIEQQCNERAMVEVSQAHHDLHPDEVVAYAFSTPKIGDDWEKADGAAIRSGEHWYHLSYKCKTSEDGMEIRSFSYTLGAEVPKSAWAEHYLVP